LMLPGLFYVRYFPRIALFAYRCQRQRLFLALSTTL
jgi:hypothetical protein